MQPRRSLTAILYTDIVDSTRRRAAELGDREWRKLLDGCMNVRSLVILSLPIGLLASAAPVRAQVDTIPHLSPFRPLDLPAPNVWRAGDGRPGPEYWQQRVDYRIRASVDPAAKVLTGRESIRYENRSPLPLPYLWMHLEQNVCAPTSVASTLDQPPLVFGEVAFDFSCQGFEGGIALDEVSSSGRPLDHEVYGTTMRVDLPEPLPPGGAIEIEIAWSFPIPPYGAGRMGIDGDLYEIAWWYPRLAVYDDVRGWNHEPYIGAGEFYLEYGSFDVELTVPPLFLVFATGELRNPEAVLTAAQRERLERAMSSDESVAIVTAEEAGTPATRPSGGGSLTWHFTADSVRDFAFAMSPNVRWDATSWDGIRIETVYRPGAANWEEAIRMAEHTIRHFSERWRRYPYPHATTIEGPIAGMEYPMITFVAGTDRENLHFTLMHELGHEWFPMVVGSNERLHPWMDEGLNTFIDTYGQADYFAGTAFGDTIGATPLHEYPAHAISGVEQPIALRPVEHHDLFWTAYRKPALLFRLLRDEVVGAARFDRSFRAYADAWAFKHPTPADFFRMMADGTGMDLDWFWREWLYETARLDVAIAEVKKTNVGTGIVLENRGEMVMPVELEVTYADGETETVRLPVEMWNLGDRFLWGAPGRNVIEARVDPRGVYPDVDRSNDRWSAE
jgi:hypothetical protein